MLSHVDKELCFTSKVHVATSSNHNLSDNDDSDSFSPGFDEEPLIDKKSKGGNSSKNNSKNKIMQIPLLDHDMPDQVVNNNSRFQKIIDEQTPKVNMLMMQDRSKCSARSRSAECSGDRERENTSQVDDSRVF